MLILLKRYTHTCFWLALGLLMMLTGCVSSKDFIYLEDLQPGITINLQDPRPLKLQSGDKLYISVHSRDKELVEMFNISSGGASTGQGTSSYYTVDDNGKIEMPIIGSIHVKGLSRVEVQNIIRYKLLASKLVRDPIVMVEFKDMCYYVMGEMGSGRNVFVNDNLTLIEAISECGGLSTDGRRDNVIVMRRTDGQQTPYEVNVTKTADVYSSPVYYLQQNDIIYVKPTEEAVEAARSPFGSAYRNPMFWIGIFNTALSMVLLFYNL